MSTEKLQVKFKKLSDQIGVTIPEPAYATSGSAGIDLAAALEKSLFLAPGDRASIPTGLAIDMPAANIVGLVFPRSGLAGRQGISLANCVGVIDSDYKGEIICILQNNSSVIYEIKPGDRVAQLVFVPCLQADIVFTQELSSSERNTGGFGSTGR